MTHTAPTYAAPANHHRATAAGSTHVSVLAGRIAFFVRAFDGGGAQRDTILLANAVARAGRPTALVTLHAQGPLLGLVARDVPVVDLGGGAKLRMARALPMLRHMLRDGRPSHFIASEAAGNALAVLASRGLPRTACPRIVLREVASALHARRNDPYRQNRIAYRLAPLLYPMADQVIALTRAGRNDLVAAFRVDPERVVALGSNAVLTADMLARIARTPRAPEAGLIVAVGRLSPEKGFDALIAAVAEVACRCPVRLVIAGEGAMRSALETQIAAAGLADTVTLSGFMTDTVPLLRRAALFVSASTHEGLGNAIIEAMACGVPVVATDAPHGPREVLGGGAYGTLVPVGDVQALAAAIEAALAAPDAPSPARTRAHAYTDAAAARALLAALDGAAFGGASLDRGTHR